MMMMISGGTRISKVGGQEGGNDWLWGGGAHSEREARADFFELLGSDLFWANMCAERT